MKKIIQYILIFLGFSHLACAQAPENRPAINNADFDKKISQLISFSVPTMGVQELKKIQETEVYILDAREKEEYNISHIPNAIYIGYKDFDIRNLNDIPKNAPVVVYCSIGYRSEKIGEKLLKDGFTNVHNLYGSIFEWVNQGNPVVTPAGEQTTKIHTYNKKWSKWVDKDAAERTW